MNEIYMKLATPPQDATKPIQGGSLKGKTDINPQWRWEALTDVFGLCGDGWKYEIVKTDTVPVDVTKELMIFVTVNFYYKLNGKWSEPVQGFGGDFLIVKDRNGIHGNDEALKMAITDALGYAVKMIGVAADVYRGKFDSKYGRNADDSYGYQYSQKQETQQRQSAKQQKTAEAKQQKPKEPQTVKDYYDLVCDYASKTRTQSYIVQILKSRFNGKSKFTELSLVEAKAFWNNIDNLIETEKQLEAEDDARLMEGVG